MHDFVIFFTNPLFTCTRAAGIVNYPNSPIPKFLTYL